MIALYSLGINIPENEQLFSQGWSFMGRKRDDYDSEWESFVEHTSKYMYWYICHVLFSEIVRQIEPHVSLNTMNLSQILKIQHSNHKFLFHRESVLPILPLVFYSFVLTSIRWWQVRCSS